MLYVLININLLGENNMFKRVSCPKCGHRLFDKKGNVEGAISIKCPHCRKVSEIHLEKNQ